MVVENQYRHIESSFGNSNSAFGILRSNYSKVCFILMLLLLSTSTFSQSEGIWQDANGLTFEDLLRNLQAHSKVKFLYRMDILPGGTWKYDRQSSELLHNLDGVLDDFGLVAVQYNEYLYAILESKKWQAELSPAFLAKAKIIPDSVELSSRSHCIGSPDSITGNLTTKLSIRVVDGESDEPVIGCLLTILPSFKEYLTDVDGVSEAEIEIGQHQLLIQSIGYDDELHDLTIYGDGSLDIKLVESVFTLGEVVVVANLKDDPEKAAQTGLDFLSSKRIRETPAFLGEADIIKNLLFLPGITSIGEGAAGFNVRGGNIDENLVLFDEIILFNTTHTFGLFGALNPDLVSGVNLYKGSIPAQFGGRISSAMVLDMKTPTSGDLILRGGISPVSTKLSMETPVFSQSGSLIFGARTTYSDWILGRINVPEVQESKVKFYDANLRLQQQMGQHAQLLLSGYISSDAFRYSDEFGFEYSMLGVSGQWLQKLSDRISSLTSIAYGDYESLTEDLQNNQKSRFGSGVSYIKFKERLEYKLKDDLSFSLGASSIHYSIKPGAINPLGDFSSVVSNALANQKAIENALFSESIWKFSDEFILSAGLRFSNFNLKGPAKVFIYGDADNKTLTGIIDTVLFPDTDPVISYGTFEPRLSLSWVISTEQSLSAGYSRTAQYLFQITNRDSPLPSDIWKVSDTYLPPIKAHNFSVSSDRTFLGRQWELSLGLYYRTTKNLSESREFADLILNDHLETETVPAEGQSFGVELGIKKNVGVISGSLAYTFSRSRRRTLSTVQSLSVNQGDWYPSNFDTPHNLHTTIIYNINNRHKIAFNFAYNRGRPITAPTGFFNTVDDTRIPIYSERNAVRISDYHRLDITYTLGQSHRRNKKWKHNWSFGIYNLYGRRNAYSVFFRQNAFSNVESNRLSILGSAFPAVSYNFSFNPSGDEVQ